MTDNEGPLGNRGVEDQNEGVSGSSGNLLRLSKPPYSTNKIESPCANPRYSHSLKRFSYLLTAVDSIYRVSNGVDDGDDEKDEITARPRAVEVEK